MGDLSTRERKLLESESWCISDVVLWELAKLVQLGRIQFDLHDPELSAALSSIHAFPITTDIAHQSTTLDFDSDPADEIIAATSIVHRIPLITRDRKILKSKMVPFKR